MTKSGWFRVDVPEATVFPYEGIACTPGYFTPLVSRDVQRRFALHVYGLEKLNGEGSTGQREEEAERVKADVLAMPLTPEGLIELRGFDLVDCAAPALPYADATSAEVASLPRAIGSFVVAKGISNLMRWAMTWAASEIARENAKAQAEQNAKRDAERAALVKEIRTRRVQVIGEGDQALAFQLAPRELFMVTASRAPSIKPVPWVELDQIPIAGTPRFDVPTEGVVAAYAGRVFVIVQLRRHEGWDPVWCLLSLSGDVCGYTEGGA